MMNTKHILVVDDDSAIRDTYKLALEVEGYEVSCASDGQDALQKLESINQPDLILLDLMMPIMNGWQFLETLRKLKPELAEIPIVVLTAFRERIGELRVKEVLKKPVDLKFLYDTVKKLCAS